MATSGMMNLGAEGELTRTSRTPAAKLWHFTLHMPRFGACMGMLSAEQAIVVAQCQLCKLRLARSGTGPSRRCGEGYDSGCQA